MNHLYSKTKGAPAAITLAFGTPFDIMLNIKIPSQYLLHSHLQEWYILWSTD